MVKVVHLLQAFRTALLAYSRPNSSVQLMGPSKLQQAKFVL